MSGEERELGTGHPQALHGNGVPAAPGCPAGVQEKADGGIGRAGLAAEEPWLHAFLRHGVEPGTDSGPAGAARRQGIPGHGPEIAVRKGCFQNGLRVREGKRGERLPDRGGGPRARRKASVAVAQSVIEPLRVLLQDARIRGRIHEDTQAALEKTRRQEVLAS